jgi:hypothetical protein
VTLVRTHYNRRNDAMKYLLAIFADYEHRKDEDFSPAWRAYDRALRDAGVMLEGNGLQHPSTATTIRLENGRRLVQDGPFANTREQLGGYIILDLPSLDEALDWAARCPAADYGVVEVRPVMATP